MNGLHSAMITCRSGVNHWEEGKPEVKPAGYPIQKLKVLPLTWFYGGKEPADNPFLPRAHEPATP